MYNFYTLNQIKDFNQTKYIIVNRSDTHINVNTQEKKYKFIELNLNLCAICIYSFTYLYVLRVWSKIVLVNNYDLIKLN